MKHRSTRKVNRKRRSNNNTNTNTLQGGQSPPPFADSLSSDILPLLLHYEQEAATLASWAQNYQTATTALNNPTAMSTHQQMANDIAGQALVMYNAAQKLWGKVYGTPWVPPPSPAPAPPV